MEFHPLADIFPMLSAEEFAALKADIAEHGLLEPIVLAEGKIADGRNRYLACQKLDIEPRCEQWDGQGSLLAYIISKNLHRRHLSESQRAMVAAKIANMRQGARTDLEPRLNLAEVAKDEAARILNISRASVTSAKKVLTEGTPELIESVESGKVTVHAAVKEIKRREIEDARNQLAEQGQELESGDRWFVEVGDVRTYSTKKTFDFIITDPPYPKKYLSLYEVLARRSKEWLKPSGLLIVMCGQSYLDQIYQVLSEHLIYYWTSCYLTPGQPTPLRHKQVNCSWKPILIYSVTEKYSGKSFGDVYTSPRPEKDKHDWGQSVDGMYSLISQICLPGQSVFDPFLGAGTTGVAALKHGCFFHGIDIDEQMINISRVRLSGDTKEV